MVKKLSMFLILAAMAMVLAACGSSNADEPEESNTGGEGTEEAQTVTIKHQLGETEVDVNPEKVVVFDFGALDTLDKLGVEVTGVPQANIPSYLSKYEDAKYENVGSLKEPDFEKINELGPDLIIISGRQSEAYDELSKIGPTIFVGLDTSRYMESFEENLDTLGQIFEKEDEIATEFAAINESIDALNAKITEEDINGLIVLANEGNLAAYGTGSRFGIIHDVLGVKPVDESIKVTTHGDQISPEFIVEKDPQYLFVVDRGAAVAGGESSAKELVENSVVSNTTAFKEGNIIYLSPDYWYLSGGGLISVAEMIKEIENGL